MKITQKYIKKSLFNINVEISNFLYRQTQRMPDYYRFGLNIILFIFYILNIPYKKINLLNKLFQSLITLKKYESE